MEEILQDRIDQLRDVIAWSKENGGLTDGQRICLHQIIAKSMHDLESLKEGIEISATFVFPNKIAEKVPHIIRVIQNTNWQKKEFKY